MAGLPLLVGEVNHIGNGSTCPVENQGDGMGFTPT
jgi:hypothetical protein